MVLIVVLIDLRMSCGHSAPQRLKLGASRFLTSAPRHMPRRLLGPLGPLEPSPNFVERHRRSWRRPARALPFFEQSCAHRQRRRSLQISLSGKKSRGSICTCAICSSTLRWSVSVPKKGPCESVDAGRCCFRRWAQLCWNLRHLVESRPTSVEIWPILVELGPKQHDISPIWLELANSGQMGIGVCQNYEPSLAKSARLRPNVCKFRSNSVSIRRSLAARPSGGGGIIAPERNLSSSVVVPGRRSSKVLRAEFGEHRAISRGARPNFGRGSANLGGNGPPLGTPFAPHAAPFGPNPLGARPHRWRVLGPRVIEHT